MLAGGFRHRSALFCRAFLPDILRSTSSRHLFHETGRTFTSPQLSASVSDRDVHLQGLNPSQVEAVTQPHHGITRVVAGPGAGKTRVLTCRIAHLLRTEQKENSRADRILAVTFTKKAAGEMKHRLETLLQEQEELDADVMADGIDQSDAGRRWDSIMDTGDGSAGDDIVQEEAPPVLLSEDGSAPRRAAPAQMDRVTLGTFHSVCAKILRWNGKELSSLPSIRAHASVDSGSNANIIDGSFAIVDQSEQMRIVKEILKEKGINLKGSGGKADIRPITVLNAVCAIKSADMVEAVQMRGRSGVVTEDMEDDNGIEKMSKKVRNIASEIYPQYRQALLTSNSLDFDDLILLTRELLIVNNDVRENLHRRWNHILVDEFQDTSRVQLDLVKLLTTNSLLVVGDGDQSIYSWRGAHAESMANFVTEFQGHCADSLASDADNSDEGESSTSEAAEVNTVFLMENYRSTTNIVKAAQKVISDPLSGRSKSDLERQDMKPMRGKGPKPRVLACADAKAEASFVVKSILGMVDEGELSPESTIAIIYRTNAQSRALEEECVSKNLRYLVRGSAGTFYSRQEVKDCLCFLKCIYNSRDRSAMIRASKTPSRGIGDVAMKEFFTYCDEIDRFLANNHPDEPRTNPLQVLISLVDETLAEEKKFPPAGDVMSTRALNRFLPFASQMKSVYAKSASETVSALLSSIIDDLDLRAHFDNISKTTEEFQDRMSNVMELLNAAERYDEAGPSIPSSFDEAEAAGESPLGLFLDDVALLTETENDSDESASSFSCDKRAIANLMTIHASKGMEFDCVFLVGNEEGTFPTQRSISEGDGSVELDEERRLCYVAMTRAKTHLVLTWRREVMTFFGQGFKIIDCERSRFLDRLVANGTKKGKGKKKVQLKSGNPREKSEDSGGSLAERRKKLLAMQMEKEGSARSARRTSGARQGDNSRNAARAIPPPRSRPYSSSSSTSSYHSSNSASSLRNKSPQGSSWEDWTPKKASTSSASLRRTPRSSLDLTTKRKAQHGKRSAARSKRPATRNGVAIRDRPPSRASQQRRKELHGDPSASTAPPQVDSTLFFPVGTSVVHTVHGEGKVLPPPKVAEDGNMLVRVEFEDGIEMDLPVGGGLRHKF